MSVTLSLFAGVGAQFLDNNGVILSGGLIYTYTAGTTTPLTTYTTNLGTVAQPNPIVLDSAGRIPGGELWLTTGYGYKFVTKDSNGVLIGTYDNVPSSAQPPITNDASSIAYEQGALTTAGSFVIGDTYLITYIGTTNFQLIGAASNTIGIYFIATGPGTGTGTAEFSRTVQSKLQEVVSVKDFGATGDGTTDDTIAFQNAINYVKTHTAQNGGNEGAVFIPCGNYLITKSLNCTNNNYVGNGYKIYGEASNQSIIHSKLTEAYPVFDFTGNTGAEITDLAIGQKSGCQATVGILFSYAGGDTVGAGIQARRLYVYMSTAIGILNDGTDSFEMDRVFVGGTYGCITGASYSSIVGITSKYQTIIHNNGDFTYQNLHDCQFVGGLPLLITGSGLTRVCDSYIAATNLASSPVSPLTTIAFDNSNDTLGITQIYFDNVRTEDQTGTSFARSIFSAIKQGSLRNTGLGVLKLNNCQFEGNRSAGSSIFYSTPTASLGSIEGTLGSESTPILFTCTSTITSLNLKFLGYTATIGTITPKISGYANLECLGDTFSLTDLATISTGSNEKSLISGNGNITYSAIDDYAFNLATGLKGTKVGTLQIPSTRANYTGGSGIQPVMTYSVPGGFVTSNNTPARTLELNIPAITYSSCTLYAKLVQGANILNLGSVACTANGMLRLYVYLTFNSSTSAPLWANIEYQQNGVLPYINVGNSNTIDPTNAWSIVFSIDSSDNSPWYIPDFPTPIYR